MNSKTFVLKFGLLFPICYIIAISDRSHLMKEFISQSLLFLAEIGVIVVMLIIIVKERRKIKESDRKSRRSPTTSAAPKSQTLYLD